MRDDLFLVTIGCAECGPGLAPLEAVTLRINVDTGEAAMAYPCSVCGVRTALKISAESARRLCDAGVLPEYWTLPAEVREPVPSGPPLRCRSFRELANELAADIEGFTAGAGPDDR